MKWIKESWDNAHIQINSVQIVFKPCFLHQKFWSYYTIIVKNFLGILEFFNF